MKKTSELNFDEDQNNDIVSEYHSTNYYIFCGICQKYIT